VIYSAAALAIAMGGYGRLSLDALFGLDEPLENDALVVAVLGGGVLGGILALAQREKPAPES
jgi:threonine dehydratase